MKQFTYVVKDPEGIHARPAGVVVAKAKEFKSEIIIDKDGKQADAKKIFKLMGLAVKNGNMITVTVEGEDEDVAAAEMEAILNEKL